MGQSTLDQHWRDQLGYHQCAGDEIRCVFVQPSCNLCTSLDSSTDFCAHSVDLHPLALEDVLHQRGNARSKADYYPQHLFIRTLIHMLADDDDTESDSISHLPRSDSPEPMGDQDEDESESQFGKLGKEARYDVDDERTVFGSANASRLSTMGPSVRRRFGQSRRKDEESPAAVPMNDRFAGMEDDGKAAKNARNRKFVRELKRGDRVNVKIQPLCLFLFRDGTVISIHKGEFASSCTSDFAISDIVEVLSRAGVRGGRTKTDQWMQCF